MKTKTITLLTLITPSAASYAQNGGINTTAPTKILDIDGDLRVRTLPIMPGGTP
ncbi:hypothetical protein [Chryseobacterium sp.]|uniref:hypothetical protein n=1 Tax=Chryseobacterium sp. TaxID=1871047 RepID=UPI002FC7B4B6